MSDIQQEIRELIAKLQADSRKPASPELAKLMKDYPDAFNQYVKANNEVFDVLLRVLRGGVVSARNSGLDDLADDIAMMVTYVEIHRTEAEIMAETFDEEE